MKPYMPTLLACFFVGAILIGVSTWIPRLAFLLMIPFALVGIAFSFGAKKNRVIALALVFFAFLGVGLARVDVVFERGQARGFTFQKVIWGRAADVSSEDAYLAGCEPPRFEPTRVLVVRI